MGQRVRFDVPLDALKRFCLDRYLGGHRAPRGSDRSAVPRHRIDQALAEVGFELRRLLNQQISQRFLLEVSLDAIERVRPA